MPDDVAPRVPRASRLLTTPWPGYNSEPATVEPGGSERHARQSRARYRAELRSGALREARLGGYRLNWKKAPGRPDIAYPGRKVAVFVHGCYWHHCPRCYPNLPKSNPEFWARKFELNRERDARKRRDLEPIGWVVVEAWECDVRERLPTVVIDVDGASGPVLDENRV